MTHVVINDYVIHQRVDFYFTHDDFYAVDAVWEDSDKLLHDLQNNDLFKGKLRWCDLEPMHYRLMVTKNIQQMAKLTLEERGDPDHPYVKSLHFVICGLIRSLELRTESNIETIKFHRVGEYDVSVEYQSVMIIHQGVGKKPGISVIVDNT